MIPIHLDEVMSIMRLNRMQFGSRRMVYVAIAAGAVAAGLLALAAGNTAASAGRPTRAAQAKLSSIERHFRIFERSALAHAADVPVSMLPPDAVARYGLSPSNAVATSFGTEFRGWAIPGSAGVCIIYGLATGPTAMNPESVGCTATQVAMSVGTITTSTRAGQDFLVALVPDQVTQVGLESSASSSTSSAADSAVALAVPAGSHPTVTETVNGKTTTLGGGVP